MAVVDILMCLGIWTAVFSNIILVKSYPTGAPATACVSMAPIHTGFSPSLDPPPFRVSPLTGIYQRNGTVIVMLTAPCGTDSFGGFLLEARRADVKLNRDEPIGTFESIPEAQFVSLCGNGRQAVTHRNANPKYQLSFAWRAPQQPTGHIVFVATFAASKSSYWVKVYSDVVRDDSIFNIGVDSGNETYPTPSRCSVNPTNPPIPQLPLDPECDISKFCFKNCQLNSCSFLVTWQNSTNYKNGIEFEVAATVDRTTNKWMAIGFSQDNKMGEDKVVECVSFNDEIKVHTSYNTLSPNVRNIRNENPHDGDGVHSLNTSSLIDGVFRCSFVIITKEFSYINLTEPQYLLFAAGNTATFKDTKLIHPVDVGQFPPVSKDKIDFRGVYTNMTVEPNSSATVYVDFTQTVICLFVTVLFGPLAMQ